MMQVYRADVNKIIACLQQLIVSNRSVKLLTKKNKKCRDEKNKEQDLKRKRTRRNDACKSKGTIWI